MTLPSSILKQCTSPGKQCGFPEVMQFINLFVQYAVYIIGLLFVIVLIYAGFLYLTSGGDTGKVKKVKDMIKKMVWGLIWTLCGWLIVYFILQQLGVGSEFYKDVIGS